jgi:hypothetical protein
MAQDINTGDSVRTTKQLYLVEASHPETGDEIETMFPRWHRLTVCGTNAQEETVDVELPDGYVATLSQDDVEL